MSLRALLFIVVMMISGLSVAQKACELKPEAFKKGERLSYIIYYNWQAVWVKAGVVTFSVKDTTYKGKSHYFFDSYGKTLKKWDWFYKVRDRYQSITSMNPMKTKYFYRDVKEGGFTLTEKYKFDHKRGKVYTEIKPKKKAWKKDTVKINRCTMDPLAMIYHARCIDFSKYKVDDKIPISIIVDNKEFPSYIRYLGKEEHYVKGLGRVPTIKFKPLLIEGTIFNGGEEMTVWVTDDKNKVPVHIDTKILVGSIKVYLIDHKGLVSKFPEVKPGKKDKKK